MARPALESAIQTRVKKLLIRQGCHVEVMSCNAFQKGIPDLYVFHPGVSVGDHEHHWWVDVKRPKGSTLTKSQCQKWTLWETLSLGVWILDGSRADPLTFLMNEAPNFRDYWKPRYDKFICRNPADLVREEFPDGCSPVH